LNKVLLSPYGGTAIVEFIEPSEARKAFKRLAYSRFKHTPLYLEWAPENIFKKEEKGEKETSEVKEEEVEAHIPVEGSTLYVKGINFSTNSDTLKKVS